MEGDLGALAHRAEEDERKGHEEVGFAEFAGLGHREDVLDVERAGFAPQEDDAGHEADVAHAGGDEGLLGRLGSAALLPVEADEKEGADADELPRDEEEEQVVGHHERQHRRCEKLEQGEEPPVAGLTLHVADGEDVHHQRDRGHHREHDDGDLVDVDAEVDIETADLAPVDHLGDRGSTGLEAVEVEVVGEDEEEEDEGRTDGEDAKVVAPSGQPVPE